MTATQSLKLLELFRPFVQEEDKARELVTTIEEIIETKFEQDKKYLATKQDLAETEMRINKTIYIVGLVQFLAIVGSVLAIVNFMLK